MNFSDILRTLFSLLSFWYSNKDVSHKKDLYIRKKIQKKKLEILNLIIKT